MAMSEWIKVVVQPKPYMDGDRLVTPAVKETIIAATGLELSKRVMKEQLIDFYYCDEKGVRIKGAAVPSRDPNIIAFEALKAKAKELKIPGFATMKMDALLRAVQQANNPGMKVEVAGEPKILKSNKKSNQPA